MFTSVCKLKKKSNKFWEGKEHWNASSFSLTILSEFTPIFSIWVTAFILEHMNEVCPSQN